MKFLIVGLGNIGNEYQDTRHNIGFTVLDALAKASNLFFSEQRYGSVAELKLKGHVLILLKPSTFMNLSGNAVRYWMQKENIPVEQLLVVVDDLAIPFGSLRLKPRGSDAGHNGLKNIQELLGSDVYPRLRFGLGGNFPKGQQIQYVLGKFPPEEQAKLPERLDMACEMIKSFCLAGMQNTMNAYNNK
ncbi:MAG: aminoacyl-tRNA hydrolase [Paludibacteraceae bacterium]|nr:aminoacyl-tRNA hydrolase [Paludibacteraceae bacterium]